MNRELRQGCQRLGRRQHRGKKTPTLVSPSREAVELENSVDDDPPKRSTNVVKRSVPRSYRTEP
jgi:hypothetical protein